MKTSPLKIRVPIELKEKLQRSAEEKKIEINQEIVKRINNSFSNDEVIPSLRKLKCWLEIRNKNKSTDRQVYIHYLLNKIT